MDRSEIEQMEAGPKMDMLISKIIFGHSVDEWNRLFFQNRTGFSADGNAALALAQKMHTYTRWFELTQLLNGLWRANFTGNSIDTAQAPTAPLAICRAALLANAKG